MTASRRAMRTTLIGCAVLCALGLVAMPPAAAAQSASTATGSTLPPDVHPDSRSRLPPLKRENLDQQGREFYDALAADSRRLTGVGGPSGIRMYSPQAGDLARRLNNYLRFDSALGARTVELAILVTAREYDSQFEWSAHEPVALKAGVSKELVELIKRRAPVTTVSGMSEQDAAIIELGREVFGTHRVSSATYARALKALGPKNLVDLTVLIGEYSSTAVLLATFDQQLAAGERPPLPPR
jgi:4-carboxymuconolactone decarboxylase